MSAEAFALSFFDPDRQHYGIARSGATNLFEGRMSSLPVFVYTQIESDNAQGAAAVSVVLLGLSLLMLVAIRWLGRWGARHDG